jgi:uncharacterized protein (TIGR02246 family)
VLKSRFNLSSPWLVRAAFPLAAMLVVSSVSVRAQTPEARSTTVKADANSPQALVPAFVTAYNARDVEALAGMMTEDATLIDLEGVVTRGKAAIGDQFRTGFADPTEFGLEANVDYTRMLTDTAAQLEGTSHITLADSEPTINRWVMLAAKKNDKWLIAEIRDVPIPVEPLPEPDRLYELSWMIGDWVDQSPDVSVSSSITWGENNAYILRKYSLSIAGREESGGLMVISFDPAAAQIKSWAFDGSGSFAEGRWTRVSDSQWVIKAHGCLSDGTPTSATQYVTLVSDDVVKTGSVDQVVGGIVDSEPMEVTMVRKPPAPARTAAPAAAPAPAATGAVPAAR